MTERHAALLGRWPASILQALNGHPMRFNELKVALSGVSSKTLSLNLKLFVKLGMARRKVLGEKPNRVEYSLTEKGSSFLGVIAALKRWEDEWNANTPKEE